MSTRTDPARQVPDSIPNEGGQMSISSFFAELGAPLRNPRWSWGAVRPWDHAVLLRVWQDERFVEARRPFMLLSHHRDYRDRPENYGYAERQRHIDAVRAGARCLMVMCRTDQDALGTAPASRRLKCFNRQDLFLGGELRESDGEIWIQVMERVSVREQLMAMDVSRGATSGDCMSRNR